MNVRSGLPPIRDRRGGNCPGPHNLVALRRPPLTDFLSGGVQHSTWLSSVRFNQSQARQSPAAVRFREWRDVPCNRPAWGYWLTALTMPATRYDTQLWSCYRSRSDCRNHGPFRQRHASSADATKLRNILDQVHQLATSQPRRQTCGHWTPCNSLRFD